MTEHELQCLLVAEREWRITELEFCKKIPFLYTYPSFRSHYPLFWKFCIPMIYSHWEGFCVASMKLLVDYLNEISLSYVPYKIGKLQIQGFSEPTTPNKIKQSYHITQKAARSRPRAAFLRGKLGRRQDFSKK